MRKIMLREKIENKKEEKQITGKNKGEKINEKKGKKILENWEKINIVKRNK